MPEFIFTTIKEYGPDYGWIILLVMVATFFGHHLVQFLQTWQHWRNSDHQLQRCKTRLEIEKLRYEILDLRTKGGLPELPPEDPHVVLAKLDGNEPTESDTNIWAIISEIPFPPHFVPWRWLAKFHGRLPTVNALLLLVTMWSMLLLCAFSAGILISSFTESKVALTAGSRFILIAFFGAAASITGHLALKMWQHRWHFRNHTNKP